VYINHFEFACLGQFRELVAGQWEAKHAAFDPIERAI
jgi:hypothetical protein